MFLRWIERPSKDGFDWTALSLILAESKRIDGKPRQRHIAYLGGIRDDEITDVGSRCIFWDSVRAAFDRLDNQIVPADRKRFEVAIAARVPRPSAKAYKTAARQAARQWGWTKLSDGFKTALADEAGKWLAHDAELRAKLMRELGAILSKSTEG
jgi:hypothetical protein